MKLQEIGRGQVIDLVSNDVKRVEMAPKFLALSSLSLVELPVTLVLLLYLIGWQSLLSVLLIMAAVPCIFRLSHICALLRRKTAEQSDRRLLLMNELLSAIRAVKAHAWEINYQEKVRRIRRQV